MRAKPLIVIAVLLLPGVLFAEVYRWQDESGKIHYGERPPPGKAVRRLPAAPSAEPTTAGKKEEAPPPQAPSQSEQQKRLLAEQQALREKNCQQARINLAGIESGTIRFLIDEKGERIALEGDVRARELAKARQAVDEWCSPAGAKP